MIRLTVLRISIVILISNTALAQDWNQWRGPNRDAVVASFNPPNTWPDKLKPIWKVQVGIGHSSPVVSGKRVFIHSRKDENEVVSCFDLDTGKQLWTDSYPASYTMNPAAVSHGKGPKSTPVVADDKLYTLGISGILSCYNANSGKLLWRREFSKKEKPTSPLYGTAMSPMMDRGLLIAHVGGNDSGTLAAFDAKTGDTRWTWSADGPGYASPIVAEISGTRQIVTQTQKNIVGFSASNGLILSGLDKGVFAIKPVLSGQRWVTEELWKNTDVSMYMSSPVVIGDYIYGL